MKKQLPKINNSFWRGIYFATPAAIVLWIIIIAIVKWIW